MKRKRTALPSSNKTCAKKLAALLGRKYERIDRVVLEEGVKLRYELEQVAEDEEAAIQSPVGTLDGISGCRVDVVLAPAQDDALPDGLLAGIGLRVEVLDRRL